MRVLAPPSNGPGALSTPLSESRIYPSLMAAATGRGWAVQIGGAAGRRVSRAQLPHASAGSGTSRATGWPWGTQNLREDVGIERCPERAAACEPDDLLELLEPARADRPEVVDARRRAHAPTAPMATVVRRRPDLDLVPPCFARGSSQVYDGWIFVVERNSTNRSRASGAPRVARDQSILPATAIELGPPVLDSWGAALVDDHRAAILRDGDIECPLIAPPEGPDAFQLSYWRRVSKLGDPSAAGCAYAGSVELRVVDPVRVGAEVAFCEGGVNAVTVGFVLGIGPVAAPRSERCPVPRACDRSSYERTRLWSTDLGR